MVENAFQSASSIATLLFGLAGGVILGVAGTRWRRRRERHTESLRISASDRSHPSQAPEAPRATPSWLVPTSVEGVAFSLCDAAHNLTGRPTAVLVRDPVQQVASVVAVSAGADRQLLGVKVPPSSLAGRASVENLTLAGAEGSDLLGGVGTNRRQQVQHGIVLSLRAGRDGAGALVVFGSDTTMDSSMRDGLVSLAAEAGPLVGGALGTRATATEAMIDEVTGHHNLRGLERALHDHAVAPCSLLCVDIDQVTHLGPTTRDAALRHVARIFSSGLRNGDVPARVTGDELAVFLPRTPFHHAFGVADRLRVAVSESVFASGGEECVLTCSFGIASVPDTVSAVDDLLASAEAALNQAKAEGRNRVAAALPRGEH